jgi:hypothetical protein
MHQRIPSLIIALLMLLIPIAAQAVQFGWQPLPDGGIEYLVQVEPELLDSFRQEGFTSDIPAGLQRELRSIRITVGDGKLPNQGDVIGPKAVSTATKPRPIAATNTASTPSASLPSTQPTGNPTAAAPQSTPASGPPPETTASTFNELNLPPPPAAYEPPSQPKKDIPPDDTPRPLSSLPFFHSGQTKKIEGSNPSGNTPNTTPRLTANEAPSGEPRSFRSDPLAMDAAKPTMTDAAFPADKSAGNPTAGSTSKPWLPLMAALLGLFASVGANVYLAWIHQGVRVKYQALVRRMQVNTVAAT